MAIDTTRQTLQESSLDAVPAKARLSPEVAHTESKGQVKLGRLDQLSKLPCLAKTL